jgi:hypothetical protein
MGVDLLAHACHFIGPMMLSMETLCQSMDGMLRRIQKLVGLPWRADRLWGGVDRAAFHRLGAPWAGLECPAVDRVEEETVTPVFHSTQISGGVDRAEFLDRGGEATPVFHREIGHGGEAEEDTATREWIAPICAPRRRSAPQHGRGSRGWVGDWTAPMESRWVEEWIVSICAPIRRSASRGGDLRRAEVENWIAPRHGRGSRRWVGSGPRHGSGVGRDTRRRAWWRARVVGARARGRDTRRRWLVGARINRSIWDHYSRESLRVGHRRKKAPSKEAAGGIRGWSAEGGGGSALAMASAQRVGKMAESCTILEC